jgi:tetratricopeptide (TPR) repeat protein
MNMADAKELFLEGKKLKEKKEYEAAVSKLQECLAVDGQFVYALHAIVQCLTELGRHEEAIQFGKQLVEFQPDDNFSYIALSRAYQRAGMIPEAEHMMALGHQVAARAK